MALIIRQETASDHRLMEEITRDAFWNLYRPGCDEHFLLHSMRTHKDFVPELALVAELDSRVIGGMVYTKSTLIAEDGTNKVTLSFGPVSILPDFQRRGFGRQLIEHSMLLAAQLEYDAIIIFGNPSNYVGLGFISCARYQISLESGIYPTALLVRELHHGALLGKKWVFKGSNAFNINESEVEIFDSQFERRDKKVLPCQEAFFILSNSRL